MTDELTALREENERLKSTLYAERQFYVRHRTSSFLVGRLLDLMEAEWEVYVVRGDCGVSFTREERLAIRDRVLVNAGLAALAAIQERTP